MIASSPPGGLGPAPLVSAPKVEHDGFLWWEVERQSQGIDQWGNRIVLVPPGWSSRHIKHRNLSTYQFHPSHDPSCFLVLTMGTSSTLPTGSKNCELRTTIVSVTAVFASYWPSNRSGCAHTCATVHLLLQIYHASGFGSYFAPFGSSSGLESPGET